MRAVQSIPGSLAGRRHGRRNRCGVLQRSGSGGSMKLLRSLPASTLLSIAQALKAGRLKPPYTAFTVAEWVPQNGRDLLAVELMSLQRCGFTTTTLAITLEVLGADAAARQRAIDQ